MTLAIRCAVTAVLLLGLSNCAGFYGSVDGGRGGLAHIGAVKRGDNLYDVVWLGHDSNSADYRRDMALLQSARLCKERGFGWFKASDTSAWSTFSAQPSAESPQLTLQISCYLAEDTASPTYGVDKVIDRVTTNYGLTGA